MAKGSVNSAVWKKEKTSDRNSSILTAAQINRSLYRYLVHFPFQFLWLCVRMRAIYAGYRISRIWSPTLTFMMPDFPPFLRLRFSQQFLSSYNFLKSIGWTMSSKERFFYWASSTTDSIYSILDSNVSITSQCNDYSYWFTYIYVLMYIY